MLDVRFVEKNAELSIKKRDITTPFMAFWISPVLGVARRL
ncbi:hypothetical protein JOD82_003227 [Paenibacillus sp. 1182]|jgi:hypothetical protein|nr:hypothetical protein [Paenibacillus sp. 1182]